MNAVAELIADLVRAGVEPSLVGRVAAIISGIRNIDEQAERRRAADRARKAACKSGIPQNSAESAELVSPLVPPLSPAPLSPPIIPPSSKNTKAHALPDDWEPNAKTWTLADELGFTAQEAWDQLERMRDWARNAGGGKGRKSDWDAAFRNWLKRAADERRSKPQAPRNRNSNAESFAILDAVFDEAIRRADGGGEAGGEETDIEFPGLRKSAA